MASLANAEITEVRRAPASFAAAAVLPMVVGLVLVGVAAAIGYGSKEGLSRFWHAYLLGVTYCTTLGLGGLFFVIVHHLTGGRWGTALRRLAEITAGSLVTCAVLFLPILALIWSGNDALYPWVDRALVAADPLLSAKADYLDPKWFTIRVAACFFCWIVMARTMLSQSVAQDTSDPMRRARRMQWLSGPMVLLFAITMNFTSFDWLMSLEPHWFSTMFGVYFFAGSFGVFLAALQLVTIKLQERNMLSQSVTVDQRHDVSKLMFAFIVFWTYIAFSQYMLIWYAAIPEETMWYDLRQQGHWTFWGLMLVAGHWLIPFLGFMSKAVRRSAKLMTFWASWMLVMHWVDLVFIIQPQVRGPSVLPVPWMEALTTLGVLGVFAGAWLRLAAGKNLLPVQDPRLPLALGYHNH